MRGQKEVQINGVNYRITQFGAFQGVKLGKSVAKVALPAIASVMNDLSQNGISGVMEAISDNLDSLDEQTVVDLMSGVTKNNMAIDFDNEFAGNYLVMMKLIWEVIQFNFADFFQMVLADTEDGIQI